MCPKCNKMFPADSISSGRTHCYTDTVSPVLFVQWEGYIRDGSDIKGKGKVHRCTGTEALYRSYDP